MNLGESKLISFISVLVRRTLTCEEIAQLDSLLQRMPNQFAVKEINTLLYAAFAGRKIEAIKAYRSLTGSDLRTSKDAIEYAMSLKQPETTPDHYHAEEN